MAGIRRKGAKDSEIGTDNLGSNSSNNRPTGTYVRIIPSIETIGTHIKEILIEDSPALRQLPNLEEFWKMGEYEDEHHTHLATIQNSIQTGVEDT